MRTLRRSRFRLQCKSHRRGFTSYKDSPRQLREDQKYLLQSCPPPATPDGSGKATTLTGQSTLVNRAVGCLTGKNVIITGASRGIGAAIAERFAIEGARCVLLGRNVEALTHVKEGLTGPPKADHVVKVGDVGNLVFWKEVARSERKVDIIVNAAGITHYTALFTTQPDLLEEVVHTNLMGTMLSCRTVGKLMMGKKSTDGGCIINISSLLGLKGGKGSVGYAASKAGVIGLTRALASEIGREGIRVNVIVPGYVNSDMTAAMTPETRSKAIESIPLGRFGEASEVADAALFLATNMYANNCVLNLDGGLSAI